MAKLTKSMREWIRGYTGDSMNGKRFDYDHIYTRGRGTSFPGIAQCQRAGLIVSTPDDTLENNGWRHDLTGAGRSWLEQIKAEIAQARADSAEH